MTNHLNIEQQRRFNQICAALIEEHPRQYSHIEWAMTQQAIEHNYAFEIMDEIASIGGTVGAMADEFILAEVYGDTPSNDQW